MIFHENRLLIDDSHDLSNLFCPKTRKDVTKLLSAAVLIGVLRVKKIAIFSDQLFRHFFIFTC